MTARALSFGLTQPRILIPALLGTVFLVVKGWVIAGLVLLGVAVLKLSRLLQDDDLDKRLRWRDDKARNGIDRLLSGGERSEIDALERYAETLRRRGVDPRLAREVVDQAWDII